ncbi:MAG: DUF11 domain-containing protein, partial [bacterium]|nr:DUF11 domain-containing protein [bacterium]
LSAEHADVYAASIGAGEMVSVTLHFDKAGWLPGDAPLSARFLASPSVLPNAFDELVIIVRGVPAPEAYAAFSKSFETERGVSSYSHNGFPTALVAVGDITTFTLSIENTGTASGVFYAEDWMLLDDPGAGWGTFDSFVTPPTNYGWFDAAPFDVLWFSDTLDVGEVLDVVYRMESDHPDGPGNYGTVVPNYLDVYADSNSGHFYGETINYRYFRSFRLNGSYKESDPTVVLAGDDFTYNISLANGSSEDRYIYLSDPLPAEVDFVSATGGAVYDAGTHTVAWDGLLPGTALSTLDFAIEVTAHDPLTYGISIENTAVITYAQGGITPTLLAQMSASTYVDTDAYLDIDKSVNAIEGSIGDALNYTLVFGNNGSEAAMEVVMEDVVPSYLDV